MAKIELAIDFGSSYITVFQKDAGLVLREPSVAAIRGKDEGKKVELVEVGARAKNLLARSLGSATISHPIKEGMVTEGDVAGLLLKELIGRITPQSLLKPRISALVLISCSLNEAERKKIEKVLVAAGVKDIMLAESPAALVAYTDSIGGLYIDIGGGKTEVASVTKRGIAAGYTVNIGGNAFDNAIIDMVADNYRLKIGPLTAERIKLSSASFYENDASEVEVGGRDIFDGDAKSVTISAHDIRSAIEPLAVMIADSAEAVLSTTPPELVAEIVRKGAFLSGGGSQLPGLADFLSVQLKMPVTILDDPENAVALGGGRLLTDRGLLGELLGIKTV